jgi:hypothetical protein
VATYGNPFVIEEADIAFYKEGTTEQYWLGGCAQTLRLRKELTEFLSEVPGARYGRTFHVNEAHSIEIENVWLMKNDAVPFLMPEIPRNQRLTMVIVWLDEETGFWTKRTYYGVTAREQIVSGGPMQNLTLRAEYYVAESGEGEFSLDPTSGAMAVLYVDGESRIALYSYAAEVFTALATEWIPSLAEITVVADSVSVKIGGVLVLRATVDELSMKILDAAGGTSSSISPRLEFRIGDHLFFSLTKDGALIPGNAFELGALPTNDGFAFKDGSGNRLAVIAHDGVHAAQLGEVL